MALDFPKSNAIPAEQAQVQLTVCPDWHSLNSSYLLRGTNDLYSKKNYFLSTKVRGNGDPVENYHIKQTEIVWCLAKDLIGNNIVTRSFHSTNNSKMLRVRSSFNNYQFPPEIQILINYLAKNHDSYNDKYISEIVAAVIQPLGFIKSQYTFLTKPLAHVDTPYEIDYGGTVRAFIRKPGDSLRVESRARIAVPTPAEWNNSDWYKDREHVQGKITLYIENITAEKDKDRFESLFKGFFANDILHVETMLKNISDAGHRTIQSLSDIPTSFLNLVSTIAIDTIQRGISTGFLRLNNKFKHAHFLSSYDKLLGVAGGNTRTAMRMLIFLIFNEVKPSSYFFAIKLVTSINRLNQAGLTNEEIAAEIFESVNAGTSSTIASIDPVLNDVNRFSNVHVPLGKETHTEYYESEGLSENQWQQKISEEGEEAFNWLDLLYYTENDMSPLSSQKPDISSRGNIKMFGDYDLEVTKNPHSTDIDTISPQDLAARRHEAAQNFTIIAHQIFNLTVPTESHGHIVNGLRAEGHLYRHGRNPRLRPLIQESVDRAHRFSIEICKTILSELLPNEQRERYRIGFNPQTKTNKAMVIDGSHDHTFDHKSSLGRAAESMSKTFSNFALSMSEFFCNERSKLIMTTIEPQVQGGRAVTYIK